MASIWRSMGRFVIHYGIALVRVLGNWLFSLLYMGKKEAVPPIQDLLLFKSATSLAAEIREGKIKCADLVKAYIHRIREVNPFIHAIADESFPEALLEAQKVDVLVASGEKSLEQLKEEKPLLGVPFSVKVVISVKGMRCTAGSLLFKDLRAHEDAEAVALLKGAGAICIATTNSAEFGMNFETDNFVHGRTCNPYDTSRTCGGSSGGEGALVGSGGSVLGLGNDLAGSIRLPSYYNGIFGHKPSRGVVSNKGVFPVPDAKTNEYLSTGPMCRYAEDLVTSMKVLIGPKSPEMKFGDPVNFKEMKIYYMLNDGGGPAVAKIHKDVLGALKKVIRHFEETHGIVAKEIQIGGLKHSFQMSIHMLRNSLGRSMSDVMTGGKTQINPTAELFRLLIRRSKFTIGPVFVLNVDKLPFICNKNRSSVFQKRFQKLEQDFDAILDDHSIFLYPTYPKTAPYHVEAVTTVPSVGYMSIFNQLGMPVTQCPVGFDSNGLPCGIQVVGCKGNDHLTIACALEIEKAFGGWTPPGNEVNETVVG